jgi:acetyl-CoA carboxylase biotin carboxyl carrier protein
VEGRSGRIGDAEDRRTALGLVADLLERLRSGNVRELEIRQGDVRVKVSRSAPNGTQPIDAEAAVSVERATAAGPRSGLAGSVRAAQPAATAKGVEVTAPLTGIFYRSPSAQAPPFVQVGALVRPGDVVGLIEAMKLFNEVRSTVGGRVKRVAAENGQLVRAHQALFELE